MRHEFEPHDGTWLIFEDDAADDSGSCWLWEPDARDLMFFDADANQAFDCEAIGALVLELQEIDGEIEAEAEAEWERSQDPNVVHGVAHFR